MAKTRLKELRKARGLSLAKMEEAIGISGASINQYENDVYEPDLFTVLKLAHFFGVSVDYFLRDTDYARPLDHDHDRLLNHYDKLPPDGKEALLTLMDGLAK